MDASLARRGLRMALVLGVVYVVIGILFGRFSDWAATDTMRLVWRRLAWVVSGAGFAAHIGYGLYRLGNSPRATAIHASIAAAVGAGGLAVAANVHEWRSASSYRPSMAIALVAWPLLIAVPAFVVAMVCAAVLNRWRRRS